MSLWSSIKEIGKNTRANLVTNQRIDKGILDYDRRKEYSKLAQGGTIEQQQQVGQKMIEQGVIDPNLYSGYYKKQEEDYQSKLDDPTSDEFFQAQNQKEIEDFRTKLKENVKTNYSTGDRRQKEVLEKAVNELIKDYEWTHNNVMTTYREYKDESLLNERKNVKGEYEGLIGQAANRFSQLIGEGKSYQDAYKQIITEGKDKAKRITDIQSELRRKGDRAGIKGAFNQAGEGGLINAMGSAWKSIMNTVSGAVGLMGDKVEEGKQALGYYDTLEELSNLGVRKDNEKFKGVKQLQNRAFEVFDGAPQWVPELATIMAGNAAFNAMKLPEAITAGMRTVKLAPKAAKVTKWSRFISENLEDFLLYDAVAQASMGRPVTDQDFTENWLLNIPINLGLSRLVPTEWMTKTLPIKAMHPDKLSKGILSLLQKDVDISAKDLATSMYLDAAYRYGIDTDIAAKKIMEGVGGDTSKFKKAVSLADDDINQLFYRGTLTQQQVDKYKEARGMLESMQNDIKKGKVTLEDMYMLDLGERITKTKGQNIGARNVVEAVENSKAQYDWFVDNIKNNPYNKDTGEGIRPLYSKVLLRDINNLVNQGVISVDTYKGLVEELPEGSIGKTILASKYNPEAKQAYNKLIQDRSFGNEQSRIDINAAYDYINYKIFEEGIGIDNLKPGMSVGGYTYQGIENGVHTVFDIWTKQTRPLSEVISEFKGRGSYIGGKDDMIDDILRGVRQRGQMPISGLTDSGKSIYDVSNIFRTIISEGLLEKEGVIGEVNRILKPFGIKYDKELLVFTAKESGLIKLKDSITSLDKQGWNLSKLTKEQMNTYKVIFAKPYLDTFQKFKMPGKDFYTYFELGFKELPDGTFKINTKYTNPEKLGAIAGGVMKETKNFYTVEEMFADVFSYEGFKDISNGADVDTVVKRLTNQYQSEGLQEHLKALAGFLKDSNAEDKLLRTMANIMGDVLGDWKSNAFIQELFNNTNDLRLYRNIFSTLLAKDDTAVNLFLKTFSDTLDSKGLSKTGLYEEIMNARQLIDESKNITNIDKENVKTLLNRINIIMEDSKIELPDNFYAKYDDVKTKYDRKKFGELTESDIKTLSIELSRGIMDRYGILNKSTGNILYKRMTSILEDFRNTYPDIKLRTKGDIKGIAFNTANASLFIDDVIGVQVLSNLLNKKNYEKYVFNHEAQHIKNYADIEKGFKELANKVLENIKKIENVTENKELDSLLFYNKNTLAQSMETLNILEGDTTKLVDRLISLRDTSDIQTLYKIMDNIEEAVTEQQALYNTYGYISNKDLVKTIKDKLELINKKLSDDIIIDRWNAIAGKKDINITERLTRLDQSVKANMTIPESSIKEVLFQGDGLRKSFHDKSLTNLFEGKTTDVDRRWEDTFNYLTSKQNNNIIQLSDAANIIETSTSYIAGPFMRAIKKQFPDKVIDVSNLYIGKELLDKRNKTDKSIPLDIFITNKVIANILSSLGAYSRESVELINNAAGEKVFNQAMISIKQNKKYAIDTMLNIMLEDGITFKQLKDIDYDKIYSAIKKTADDSVQGKESGNLYKLLEEYRDKDKVILSEGGEDAVKEYLDYSQEISSDYYNGIFNTFMEAYTDKIKLAYDINLVGIETPLKTIPYNSLIKTPLIDSKELANASYNKNILMDYNKGAVLNSKEAQLELIGIKESFKKGLVSNIEFKVGGETIQFNKNTMGELNGYSLLDKFIDGLVGKETRYFEIIIDGESYGLTKSTRFRNSVAGKTILEKLDMSTPKNALYTKHLEVDIPLTNKEILQRVYDRLTIKSAFDKSQEIYKRFDEFLQVNKNIKGKELDEAITKVVNFIKKQNPDTLINEDDIKFIKSRASKGHNGINKYTKAEANVYQKLQKYLYPQEYSTLGNQKRLEGLKEDTLKVWTNEGFKDTTAQLLAVRPKVDIVEDTLEITGTTYAKDWVSVDKGTAMDYITVPDGIKGATDFNLKVNKLDGEFLVKIQSPDGKEINGLGIKEGGNIKIIPMSNIEIEIQPKSVTDYLEQQKTNIKIITDNENLMKSFLVC